MTYAGFWVRLMAHNIDLMVLLPMYYLVGVFVESDRVLILICTLITLSYEIGFTTSKWQGTPGKKYMHLKVVNANHERISIASSVLRTIIKAASLLTLFIGYAIIAFHPRKQALHDQIARTTVKLEKG